MEEKISFTKEELTNLLNQWIGYVCEDIKNYGFPEPFVNHPLHYTADYVDGFFGGNSKYNDYEKLTGES